MPMATNRDHYLVYVGNVTAGSGGYKAELSTQTPQNIGLKVQTSSRILWKQLKTFSKNRNILHGRNQSPDLKSN